MSTVHSTLQKVVKESVKCCQDQQLRLYSLPLNEYSCSVRSEKVLYTWTTSFFHLHIGIIAPWQLLKQPATLLQYMVRTDRVTIASADWSVGTNSRVHTWITVSWRCLAHVADTCWAIIKAWDSDVEMWSFTSWIVLPWALIVDFHNHLSTSWSG